MAIKYLVKTSEVLRLECMVDVEDYHSWVQEDAKRQGYQVVGFSWKEKSRKEKGEIADEWFIVKVDKVFCDDKDPDLPLRGITYDQYKYEEFADKAEPVAIELGEDFE